MATYEVRRWPADVHGATRRERSGCEYSAYLPDPLVGRDWLIAGDVAASIGRAEASVQAFETGASKLSDTEGIARLLLRAEAVASSRIEGLEAGPRRVLRAEAAVSAGEPPLDVGAEEILGNIRAMQRATGDEFVFANELTVDMLRAIHRELLAGTRYDSIGGVVRTEQNWIGGNGYNPCGAVFVPPPAEVVETLLDDLCRFCSGDSLPPLAQAAIAHAQFETIHPFADGNGRTGRALIHLVLKRRGLTAHFVPPVSLVLATWSRQYVDGLTRYRHVGDWGSSEAYEGVNQWLGLFAEATSRAMDDVAAYEQQVDALQAEWRERVGPVRAGSAVELVLQVLPQAPVLSVRSAVQLIGRSFEATNQAVGRLVAAGVLQAVKVGRRNRAFEAPELIDAFIGLERGLASATGDTRGSPPERPVPRHRNL